LWFWSCWITSSNCCCKKGPHLKIGIVSKVQVMRSHSVSAEGGTAAVLFDDEGDTIESHIYDTVKGSDFLADQDVAERLCVENTKRKFIN
jgi:succinate dehydrogenase subunit A (EC 1.3.5.1)